VAPGTLLEKVVAGAEAGDNDDGCTPPFMVDEAAADKTVADTGAIEAEMEATGVPVAGDDEEEDAEETRGVMAAAGGASGCARVI